MTVDGVATEGVRLTGAELEAVEQFLYEDAELLDTWRLHEWLARITMGARCLVPTNDLPDGESGQGPVFSYRMTGFSSNSGSIRCLPGLHTPNTRTRAHGVR